MNKHRLRPKNSENRNLLGDFGKKANEVNGEGNSIDEEEVIVKSLS